MDVTLSIKNTFVCASFDDSESAGLRRSSSCPSFCASFCVANATPREDASSTDIVSPLASADSDLTLSGLGTWADIDSDFDEQEPPSCLSSVGFSDLGFTGEAHNSLQVDEKSLAALDYILVQVPESTRTPLSSKASAFSPLIDSSFPHVPLTPVTSLNSKASAFFPRSSQTVSMPAQAIQSPEAPVPRTPSQAFACSPEITTVMLRNLPCGFTRNHLLEVLDSSGFAGMYDFVYVPIDFKRRLCKGYAFVNLVAPEHVQHLIKVFEGYSTWSHFSSSKVCQASLSHTQGLMANIERYKNSPVMGDEVPAIFKPALFEGTLEVPFPAPTRKLPMMVPKI